MLTILKWGPPKHYESEPLGVQITDALWDLLLEQISSDARFDAFEAIYHPVDAERDSFWAVRFGLENQIKGADAYAPSSSRG